MLYLGRDIVQRGVLSNLTNEEEQVQSSGVDLTLKAVHAFASKGVIGINNSQRKIADYAEVKPNPEGIYILPAGVFVFEYNEIVDIPKDAALTVHPRSSMVRNGVSLFSGLYDAGYAGPTSALIHVLNPFGLDIYRGARAAQLACHQMESAHPEGYQGKYQHNDIRGEEGV